MYEAPIVLSWQWPVCKVFRGEKYNIPVCEVFRGKYL
jgi:uncharacterized membrane protein